MKEKQSIQAKFFIEQLLEMVAQNKDIIIDGVVKNDEVVKKRFFVSVQEFLNGSITLREFFDRCRVYGLVSKLHWDKKTSDLCENLFVQDVINLGVTIPKELLKEDEQ